MEERYRQMREKYHAMRDKYKTGMLIVYNTLQAKMMEVHRYHLGDAISNNEPVPDSYLVHDWCDHDYDYLGGRTHAENYRLNFTENIDDIIDKCTETCGNIKECKSIGSCELTKNIVHRLLNDGYAHPEDDNSR